MRRSNRGSALLIVIAILVFLTALAVTFYATSRAAVRLASNRANTIRADLIANAGLAVAQSFLAQDHLTHPTLTSLDHAWRTYFNGAWFAGKKWAWRNPGDLDPYDSNSGRGVPVITFAQANLTVDGINPLYVPRQQTNDPTDLTRPFVVPSIYSKETINQWADVDNDEDGLRDSVWIPIPQDRLFAGNGNYSDGDGDQDDGLDNDLDGLVDNVSERAPFIYRDPATNLVMLTAPLDFVDTFGNHHLGTIVYDGETLTGGRIDNIDNDYSFIINDAKSYCFTNAELTDPNKARIAAACLEIKPSSSHHAVHVAGISDSQLQQGQNGDPAGYRIYSTGEPVCDVVARVAVLITDEAGKVNLNTAGTQDYDATENPYLALDQGLSPSEYDTRVLPGIGAPLASNLWNVLTGQTKQPITLAANAAYYYDVTRPGYGFVDDNGNALWLALNGLDNRGRYNRLGVVGTPVIGDLSEGIDEALELQQYRPLRNPITESDGIDNDRNGVVDEQGELGDRYLRSIDSIMMAAGIADGTLTNLKNLITAHSMDRNERHRIIADPEPTHNLNEGDPTGLRLDYNYATPPQIANNLVQDLSYRASVPKLLSNGNDVDWKDFALGLRQADTTVTTPLFTMAADDVLRAHQLAVDIKDFRDTDHARSETSVVVEDTWWNTLPPPLPPTPAPPKKTITYTQSGIESIRINEMMVRPVRRIEAESDLNFTNLNPNVFSNTAKPDFDLETKTPGAGNLGAEVTPCAWRTTISRDWIIPAPTPSGWLRGSPSGYIGDGTAWRLPDTEPATVSIQDPNGPGNPIYNNVPNMIQFRIGPSPQLPPGRYYLMVNTVDPVTGQATVLATNPHRLHFAMKYGTEDESFINDVARGAAVPTSTEAPIVGTDKGLPAKETGWVFLPVASDPTYTVTVHDYLDPNPYLYIALWKDTDGDSLSINFIEFSQEPDHEWVEVANIAESGDPINIGGWDLEVGGDASVAGVRRVFSVPDNTLIAPGGSLLLGFDKYDDVAVNTPGSPIGSLHSNGIGLARWWKNSYVTEPPIPDRSLPAFSSLESVFNRKLPPLPAPQVLTDFVDRNGDGVAEVGTPDDFVTSTTDKGAWPPLWGAQPTGPTKAWDRIVQLEGPDITKASTTGPLSTPGGIAQVVLDGGFLPDYPEHDAVDNDGDNNILKNDGIPHPGSPDPVNNPGIDEGCFLNMLVPQGHFGPYGAYPMSNPPVPGLTIDSATGMCTDPPEWKALVERRWFPGDAIVVTLYEGPAYQGRIADRVTYTERDVINRAIDDVVACPYVDAGNNPVSLDPRYLSFWPDNTMGVDFYRSLERKHPLYAGDRFGTQNRWQATDGSYDDWDAGCNRWDRFSGMYGVSVVNRLNEPSGVGELTGERLYAHAFAGSPLRMNFFQRTHENAANQFQDVTGQYPAANYPELPREIPEWLSLKARVRSNTLASAGDLVTMRHFLMAEGLYAQAPPRIDTVQTIVLGMNSVPELRGLVDGAAFDSIVLSCGQADFYPLVPGPDLSGAFPPESFDWNSATGARLPLEWSPVFLYPIQGDPPANLPPDQPPFPADYLRPYGIRLPFQLNYLFNPPAALPAGMAELDLLARWPLERRAVMYVSANPVGFKPSERDHSDPASAPGGPLPSEALFVWDADDGLENGEYDVFVAIGDNLEPLRGNPGLYPFATTLLAETRNVLPHEMAVDIELFTDRNADHRCWPSAQAWPTRDTLNRGQTGQSSESFGMVTGVFPDTDGLVRYGYRGNTVMPVRVEHNYLALFIRNWGEGGRLNRFSRVILTPRNRTQGRININTAEIQQANDGSGTPKVFDPLLGLPGIRAYFNVVGDPLPIMPSILDDPTLQTALGPFPTPTTNSSQDLYERSRRIIAERSVWPDGRYYKSTSELFWLDANNLDLETSPNILISQDKSLGATPQKRFDELKYRFSRLANGVTTRSDVFDVIVTAQAGYVSSTDLNADGQTDYRNDFVVMGEKKVHTVYERR